jgi:hypothetical protein
LLSPFSQLSFRKSGFFLSGSFSENTEVRTPPPPSEISVVVSRKSGLRETDLYYVSSISPVNGTSKAPKSPP